MTSSLFRLVNDIIVPKDLIPASSIQTKEEADYYGGLIGKTLIPFDEICDLMKHMDLSSEKVYFSTKGVSSYYYYDAPAVLVEMFGAGERELDLLDTSERIHQALRAANESVLEGDYKRLFMHADNRIRIHLYNCLFDQIPADQRYDLFLEVYQSGEYGFGHFRPDILEHVWDDQTERYKEQIKEKLDALSSGNEITVYRGHTSRSTSPEKAYSWTTSLHTALFFSNRFEEEGDVLKGVVKKQHVLDYVKDEGGEEEVLVHPDSVCNRMTMPLLKASEEIPHLEEMGLVDVYHDYGSELEEEWFKDPYGTHGVLHTKRVLLHVLSLSEALQLSEDDQSILCEAALYHDIGRTHDGVDSEHGRKSVEKMKELGITPGLPIESEQIMAHIITYHAYSDEETDQLIQNEVEEEWQDKTKELLHIFKDADGLDRVRLGDLDVAQLRTKEAVERPSFALQLYRGIR
ncbi:HD domain-containing protein (plasmid) [Pontibacillus sp. ALD_SL1]|uniref:HD domain-containing protein n=1 Tax=Pontibacillus sp. ALD_SL1 TaxID=2777185 RepID=UPI001A961E5F|nr:HD domain-containing protein [Pontibacillus sp. ALD_SL1]QST02292.1 HD domain-containing protein [Pontibacillus sp. ALD_SL1]